VIDELARQAIWVFTLIHMYSDVYSRLTVIFVVRWFLLTKMVDLERAERLWLAIAVATLWAVSVGGEADASIPVSSLEALPEMHVACRTATGRSRPRMLSCFARGIVTIVGRCPRRRARLGPLRTRAVAFNCPSSQKEEQ